MDRCNLTVLLEPGMEDMVPFLADNVSRNLEPMWGHFKAHVRGIWELVWGFYVEI